MIKIVLIGAGSGFGARLSIDMMSRESLKDCTICLCDINPDRLKKVADYVQSLIYQHNLPTKLVASTERKEVLPGADFIVTSISAGGGAYYGHPYRAEVEIPRKYGLDQSVADTCSVGGVFRFLRTGPVQHQIIRDVERYCPNAIVLNHTNPMAMLTWLHSVDSSVRNVGLCHGIQNTSQEIAKFLNIPWDEVSYKVAGINHMAWFLELRQGKKDLLPDLWQRIENPVTSTDAEFCKRELVRIEIMKQFGYFPTESSHHDSEYLPYFRRTPQLMKEFNLKSNIVSNEPPVVPEWMKETKDRTSKLKPSEEYTSGIIEAVITNVPYRFNGNVMNNGLISNLPQGSCVEVPCMVDSYGVQPIHVGSLPPQLAALNRSNIAVQELAVHAVLHKDREAAFHACAVDPLTASVLSLKDIRSMFDEIWESEKDLLQWFDPFYKGDLPEISAK
jgi:alpha-galactosidase